MQSMGEVAVDEIRPWVNPAGPERKNDKAPLSIPALEGLCKAPDTERTGIYIIPLWDSRVCGIV